MMKMSRNIDLTKLYEFIDKAGKATYAGGGKYVEPERTGFKELTFAKGDFFYRDRYAGFYRSCGTEVVRWKSKPVWSSLYGGGMVAGADTRRFTISENVYLRTGS